MGATIWALCKFCQRQRHLRVLSDSLKAHLQRFIIFTFLATTFPSRIEMSENIRDEESRMKIVRDLLWITRNIYDEEKKDEHIKLVALHFGKKKGDEIQARHGRLRLNAISLTQKTLCGRDFKHDRGKDKAIQTPCTKKFTAKIITLLYIHKHAWVCQQPVSSVCLHTTEWSQQGGGKFHSSSWSIVGRRLSGYCACHLGAYMERNYTKAPRPELLAVQNKRQVNR